MKDSPRLRSIDRWVGAPICFVFSLLARIGRKRPTAVVRKVLVIELFEMGASLMAYPSLSYLKSTLKDPELFCLTTGGMREAWRMLDIIPEENIVVVSDKGLISFLKSLVTAVVSLRREKIDVVIDFGLFMRISAILSFVIKADRRAGFFRYEFEGLYRGTFQDRKCAFNQNSHIAKNFLALTKTALLNSEDYPNFKGGINPSELLTPVYRSDSDLRQRLQARVGALSPRFDRDRTRLILVSPDVGPNLSMRNYPRQSFAAVVKGLLSHYPGSLILFIGTAYDREAADDISRKVSDDRCLNFCGETTFQELWELLSMAELLLSNDNGPAHFAAAAGTKTLALFSTDSPFVYGPLGNCVIAYTFYQCSPCIGAYNHKNSRCRDNKCLQSLAPEKVLDLAISLMEGKARYRTINNDIRYI